MSVGNPAKTTEAGPSPHEASRRDGLPGEASRLARVLATLASVLLGFVLPVLMVVANKSAPATLGAAALAANAAVLLDGRGRKLGARYGALLRSPLALLVWGVVALCVASFGWTIDPGLTRRGLVEGLPELGFALAAAAAWPMVAGRRDGRWLIAGIVVAGLLILFEHAAGMPLHALARARGEAWDLKRSAIPPLLLLWPAVALCWPDRRFATVGGLLAAVVVGIVASHSGAPGAALACAAALFGLALLTPRGALTLLAATLVVLLVSAPWTGSLLSRVLPADTTLALQEEHAEHRMVIWHAFEARGFDRPLLGHGFDASYKVAEAPRPGGVPAPIDSTRIVGFHPHDIMLQFWIEFGALGLAAAALVFCFVIASLAPRHGPGLAARLGLFAAVLGVGLVGLSAWQPWWLASIAVALLWFDHVDRRTTTPAAAG